jgi:hypothetical protein
MADRVATVPDQNRFREREVPSDISRYQFDRYEDGRRLERRSTGAGRSEKSCELDALEAKFRCVVLG